MFGATAIELVAAGEFGKMVAFTGPQIGAIKISDAIGKLKAVRAITTENVTATVTTARDLRVPLRPA